MTSGIKSTKCRSCDILLSLVKHRQGQCMSCQYKQRAEERANNRKLVQRYKKLKGCYICGYKLHAVALDLDHIDVSTKRKGCNQSKALSYSWSRKRIKEEIRKCQVLCANCHRVKTIKEKDHLK